MADTQDLYNCNGCKDEINTDRARIDCHTCPDYHLCANCFVVKKFPKPHVESHSTMVLKMSGYIVPAPPGFPPRPKPALPPRQNSTVNTRDTTKITEMPTANWGALWNVMKAPLQKKSKPSTDEVKDDFKSVDVRGRSNSEMSGALDDEGKARKDSNATSPLSQNPINTLPPSPPRSVGQAVESFDSSAPSYPVPVKWEPLFEADGTPTAIFVVLMSTLFSHLDPEHTGYLKPEIFSAFLDIQGCSLEDNYWKRTLGDEDTDMSKDVADLELGLHFSENNISHILNVRQKQTIPETAEEPSSAVEQRIRRSISFKPNMPMLSRQGFIDLMNIEYHKDLDRAHEYLKRAMKAYNIWEGLGEMPRNVLPSKSVAAEKNTETELPPPALPLRPKGGEAKIEALVNRATFDEGVLSEPLNLKGGEAKIEALSKGEEFDQGGSSKLPKVKGGKAKIGAISNGEEFDQSESSVLPSVKGGEAKVEALMTNEQFGGSDPSRQLNLKGGESKLGALMKGSEFEENHSAKTPLDDTAPHTKVEGESLELKSPGYWEDQDL